MGSSHPLNAPYQAFETADGWITIGAANQSNWLRLLDALEAPDLADDPRFRENHDRIAHLEALDAVLSPIFRRRSSAEWLGRLEAAGVPAGPVLKINELHADPQVLARDMLVEVSHERLGPVKTLGHPIKFSETPGAVAMSAPILGQHTREVLAEYGYGEGEIRALITNGAVIAA